MAQLYINFKNLSKTEIVLYTKVMALYSFNIYNTKLTKEDMPTSQLRWSDAKI